MKCARLPIQDPLIKGYLFFAYPHSILANEAKTYPWILSNYIQTCFDKDYANSPVPFTFYTFDYTICPWLKHEKLYRSTVEKLSSDILSFAKNCIHNKKYLYLYLDEYDVPNRKAYKKFSFIHENLVFGYDDGTSTFDILGFDEDSIFRATTISYKQFVSAFLDVERLIQLNDIHQQLHPNSIEVFNMLHIFEINPHAHYPFNPKLVIATLKDYLESKNTSDWFAMLREPWDRVYGLECYAYIINYYESLLKDEADYDVRYLHNLWEHKMLMTKRVEYMQENKFIDLSGEVIQKFKYIEDETFALRNNMIRYSITKDKNYIKRIISKLQEIYEMESFVIGMLIRSSENVI